MLRSQFFDRERSLELYAMDLVIISVKYHFDEAHEYSEGPHRARVTISGDDIPYEENALVISNHLSYSDFYLIHALASRRGMLGRCRYFSKFVALQRGCTANELTICADPSSNMCQSWAGPCS